MPHTNMCPSSKVDASLLAETYKLFTGGGCCMPIANSPLGIAGATLMATKFPCVTNVPCIFVNSSLHDSILAPLVVTRCNYCTMPDKHSSHLGIPLLLQHFATAPWEIQTPPFTTPLLHPLWLHCLMLLMCIWQIPSNLAWLVHPSWLNCLTFTHAPHKPP